MQLSPPHKLPFCLPGGGTDSHVCNRRNENTLWWYVKITGGLQVADSGKMFTSDWPCGKWEKQEGNPVLLSSASLLFYWSVGAMDAKVVLITGCSSGIGLSLAVRLASDPQKAFKGNQNLCGLLVPVEDDGIKWPVFFGSVLSSLCNNEKSVQKGTSFGERQRSPQGHLGHTPDGCDQPAVHPGGDGEDCGETNRRSGYAQ